METISQEDCKLIMKKCTIKDIEIVSYLTEPFSDSVIGFLGEHLRLIVFTNHKTNDKKKKYQFFVKRLPTVSFEHTEYIKQVGMFDKEIYLYGDLLAKLQICSTKQWSPKCYISKETGVLVFQDLSLKNYKTLNVRSYFNLEQVQIAVKSLAYFHSSSVVFERNFLHDKIINKYNEHLKETTFVFESNHPRYKWLKSNEHCIITLLKLLPSYKKSYVNKLNTILMNMKKMVAPSDKFLNVVNHADLWSNNVMFRYDQNGKIIHCILVDYQLARYTCPTYDLLTFIFLTTNAHFREKYLDNILLTYYKSFGEELHNYQININEIFSINDFYRACEEYKVAAIIEAVIFGTLVFLKDEYTQHVLENPNDFNEFTYTNKRADYVLRAFDEDAIYRKRVTDSLNELVLILDKMC